MAQSVKLRRGGRTIELNAAPFAIGQNFIPPAAVSDDNIAEGSSLNAYNGGVLASRKFKDRAWSFDVRLTDTGAGGVTSALHRLSSIIHRAADNDDPLYIDFKQDGNVPDPCWGQFGAAVSYEVVSASLGDPWKEFGIESTRANLYVTINALIKPFAIGKKQLVAKATGGIFEDVFGAADGKPLGVSIPEATTNKMTNPVFGNATYGTLWTTGSSYINVSLNVDPTYTLGNQINSVFVSSVNSTSTDSDKIYTQSINVAETGTHCLSAYVKRKDGAAITSSDCMLYYGGTIATTYLNLGDGFYRLSGTAAGTAVPTASGLWVQNGKSVYLCGAQLEKKAYPTLLCTGDMLGSAWTSTAHESTSTRTAATCKHDTASIMATPDSGSIRAVVRFDSLPASTTQYIFDLRSGSRTSAPYAYWDGSTGIIYFVQVTSTISIGNITTPGTYVLHFTWDASAMSIYCNGAITDTDNYIAAPFGLSLFIGSDYNGANQMLGSFTGFAEFNRALTAAQVLADYNSIAAAMARRERIEAIPFCWTVGGDNSLGLYTDHDPHAVIGSVPGNVPAITEIQAGNQAVWSSITSLILSSYPCDVNIPISELLHDLSGTALAGDYGGQHRVSTISSSTPADITGSFTVSFNRVNDMRGMSFVSLFRMKTTAAATLSVYNHYTDQIGISSDPTTIIAGTTYGYYLTKPIVLGGQTNQYTNVTQNNITFELYGAVSSGTVTAHLDYFATLPRPVAIISNSTSGTLDGYFYRAPYANGLNSGLTRFVYGALDTIGDSIEFYPNKYNHLQYYINGAGTYTTYMVLQYLYVTPRWAVF